MIVGLEIRSEVRTPSKCKLRRINPWEDEAMKYNTTAFDGDSLRAAVDQYDPTSPDTGTAAPSGPGRHAVNPDEERKPVAPQPETAEHDRNPHNGAPADESHSADRTAPVTPTRADTNPAAEPAAADLQPIAVPAPPAPPPHTPHARDTRRGCRG